MNQTANVLPLSENFSYFGPAVLKSDEQQDGTVELSWFIAGLEQTAIAQVAISRFRALKAGEEVLVTSHSPEQVYVTGLLSKPQNPLKLEIPGAYVILNEGQDSQKSQLQMFNSDNELLFTYNPDTQTSRVNIVKGDLELRTEDGDIRLNAANKVCLRSQSLEMESHKLKLHASYAKLTFDRLETATDTLIENAKNVYRSVKQLTQLRTGRMRTLVNETYHFKSNKAMIKAEQDYKVNAEKIHLG